MTKDAAIARALREAKETGQTHVVMKYPEPFSDGTQHAVFVSFDPRTVDHRGGNTLEVSVAPSGAITAR